MDDRTFIVISDWGDTYYGPFADETDAEAYNDWYFENEGDVMELELPKKVPGEEQ
jgi:hypothetical protein